MVSRKKLSKKRKKHMEKMYGLKWSNQNKEVEKPIEIDPFLLANMGLITEHIGTDENISIKPAPEINAFGHFTEVSSPLLHMKKIRSGLVKRQRTDTMDASDPDFSSTTENLLFK